MGFGGGWTVELGAGEVGWVKGIGVGSGVDGGGGEAMRSGVAVWMESRTLTG